MTTFWATLLNTWKDKMPSPVWEKTGDQDVASSNPGTG